MRINDIRLWAKRQKNDAVFVADVEEPEDPNWWNGRIDTLDELLGILGDYDKPKEEFEWLSWEI